MNKFEQLGLSSPVVEVLSKLGLTQPTPVQQQAIPMLLSADRTDFIGLAQTGTGKTAAFGLPLMDLIDTSNAGTQALILAPTRELGQQTAKQLKTFSSNNPALNIEVVYGGAPIVRQIKALRQPTQIVVATPGRLLDLIKRKAVKLDQVEYVVLDEADEMLNMGFKEAIDEILTHTGEERSIWLFSATMPGEIRNIVKKYMQAPQEVVINAKEKSNKDISHGYVTTAARDKLGVIRGFLDMDPDIRGIVFCRTKRETQQMADQLSKLGYPVEPLHGDLSQGQRDAAMHRFKEQGLSLLIATDVAARGIDVDNLTHVFHHTLPDQLESYTHRSGRTGRAGNKGMSVALINKGERKRISLLERKMNIRFSPVEVPGATEIAGSRMTRWANDLVQTKVHADAEQYMDQLRESLDHLSKDDLLKLLVSRELGQLGSMPATRKQLKSANESVSHSDRKFNRYFVNIGEVDDVNQGELLDFLSDISGVQPAHFGDISMERNCAYFEVENKKDKGLSRSFDRIEIEGRMIRVNRDHVGSNSTRPRHKGKKAKHGKPDRRKASRRSVFR